MTGPATGPASDAPARTSGSTARTRGRWFMAYLAGLTISNVVFWWHLHGDADRRQELRAHSLGVLAASRELATVCVGALGGDTLATQRRLDSVSRASAARHHRAGDAQAILLP